jgi:predicted amidophosphoribosyltransferase
VIHKVGFGSGASPVHRQSGGMTETIRHSDPVGNGAPAGIVAGSGPAAGNGGSRLWGGGWAELWSEGRRSARGLGDLVFPVECAGCGAPGIGLCARCSGRLGTVPRPHRQGAALLGCPVWFGSDYTDVVARVLRAWKDRGRPDLTDPLSLILSELLRNVLDPAAVGTDPVDPLVDPAGTVLVPVPSRGAARRERGGDMWRDAVLRAADRYRRDGGGPVRVAPVLTLGRRVRDQSGLTSVQRFRNLSGAMRVPRGGSGIVGRRACLVVDDIITTTATVGEAVRTLCDNGVKVVGVLALSATPRRS